MFHKIFTFLFGKVLLFGRHKVLNRFLIKAYQSFFLSGSDWEYTIWCTLSTHFCESAHYNDNLGPSLTGVTICHSLLCNRSIIARLALKQKRAAATYAAARGLSALGVSSLP